MSRLNSSENGGSSVAICLQRKAGGVGLSWSWRSGGALEMEVSLNTGGCSNVGITYTINPPTFSLTTLYMRDRNSKAYQSAYKNEHLWDKGDWKCLECICCRTVQTASCPCSARRGKLTNSLLASSQNISRWVTHIWHTSLQRSRVLNTCTGSVLSGSC